MSLLSIHDLQIIFRTHGWNVYAVDKVDLTIEGAGRIALIGETGCGKSVLGLAIMGLLPPTATVSGKILWRSLDLLRLRASEQTRYRGRNIGLVPQNPTGSLNPVVRIGPQIEEMFRVHFPLWKDSWKFRSMDLLARWGFDDPDRTFRQYVHELSGGMRQRALMAICQAGEPDLLIVDEPTKGLDPLLRAQAIRNLDVMVSSENRAMLLITHDIPMAEALTQRIAIMYAGQVLEQGLTRDVLREPRHPYTAGLLASLPQRGLHPVPGVAPSMTTLPEGCRFRPRCQRQDAVCVESPPLISNGADRCVRCFHPLG